MDASLEAHTMTYLCYACLLASNAGESFIAFASLLTDIMGSIVDNVPAVWAEFGADVVLGRPCP
jgi:hypothetical protein